MVHFAPLPSPAYVFSGRYSGMSQSGFPHSEIPGSKPACGSPGLIATYYVLLRLLAPRHSPHALSSLITKLTFQTLLRFQRSAFQATQRIIVICPKNLPMCSCQRTSSGPMAQGALRPKPSSPIKFILASLSPRFRMVGLTGLEPVTLRLSSACSNQLSYRPRIKSQIFKFEISNAKAWWS